MASTKKTEECYCPQLSTLYKESKKKKLLREGIFRAGEFFRAKKMSEKRSEINMKMSKGLYDRNLKEKNDSEAESSMESMDKKIKQKKAAFERFFIFLLSI